MAKRWSASVARGVNFAWNYMATELQASQLVHIECISGRNPCDCEQCRNAEDLRNGLEWLEDQLRKRDRAEC